MKNYVFNFIFSIFQILCKPDKRSNEYDTIEIHEEGNGILKEKIKDERGKSSEKEVLLEMTNVEKSPFQLNKKYKDGNDSRSDNGRYDNRFNV